MTHTFPYAKTRCCALFSILFVFTFFLFGPVRVTVAAESNTDEVRRWLKNYEQARINLIDKVQHSVVAIYGKSNGPKDAGGGSGVLIHPDGYVLTNFHVVGAMGPPYPSELINGVAGLADGKRYPWKLIGIDPGGDLAIIQLLKNEEVAGDMSPPPDVAFPYAQIGDSDQVRVGEFVLAMGNPFLLTEDEKPTVTMGIVSGVKRYQEGSGPNMAMLEYGECIQIDSSINPGNSGGPLFNMKGQLIGINGRGSFEERGRVNVGVGYAISMKQCLRFIPDLLATKIALHGRLPATYETRGGRVICTAIESGSTLYQKGFRLGDRMKAFDGVEVRSANLFGSQLATYPASWPLTISRYGRIDRNETRSDWTRLLSQTVKMGPARPRPPQPPKVPEKKKPEDEKESPNKKAPKKAPKKPGMSAEHQKLMAQVKDKSPGDIYNQKRNEYEAKRLVLEAISHLMESESDGNERLFEPDRDIDEKLAIWLTTFEKTIKSIHLSQEGFAYVCQLIGAEPVKFETNEVVAYKVKLETPTFKAFLWLTVLDSTKTRLKTELLRFSPDEEIFLSEQADVFILEKDQRHMPLPGAEFFRLRCAESEASE